MIVIIMAGGIGKRMESDLPKVLHPVVDPDNTYTSLPMLIRVTQTALKLNPSKIFIIVGKFRNIITETINQYIQDTNMIKYIDQETPLGTGHAIKCTLPFLYEYSNDKALILSGDVPLISLFTLSNLISDSNKLLITELENPYGCGRILFEENTDNNNYFTNKIIGIREEKDCSDIEKNIKFVNCGIYQIAVKNLIDLIPLINNNNKSNEYYLTDIVDLMVKNNIYITPYILIKCFQWEIKNVNTKKDLKELNNYVIETFQ